MNATLPKIATVHETTVKKAQALVDDAAKVHRIRTGHQHRTVTHYVKVDPRVWKAALKIANGDQTRITVVHETEVIVRNDSKKKGR
jgi:hypothetical protein